MDVFSSFDEDESTRNPYSFAVSVRLSVCLSVCLSAGKIWPRPARAAADAPRCRPRAALQEGGCRRAALPATIDTLSELWARALEVSAGRAAAALRARDGAGRVLGSRAEPLAGKALPKTDAAPAAPAGPATAAADALQRAREDRDRLIRDLKRR
ncbi:hypothetical protein MSG28_001856 [Choristoneura fumiferana]|uniref:Uncharacterized protein n=1 Tax=Choristoneura fumiferana TaxID=7141 RepID=A0ACC0KVY3_CHOFU|nr:hypothetical protein MSG28_001856 [Choristoneura fumiferana]